MASFFYFRIFTSAKPRPNHIKMTFGKTLGWRLSISMCMQNFIEILQKVQEIRPVLSEFGRWQRLDQ